MNFLSFRRGEKGTEVKLNFWRPSLWQSCNKLHWKAWRHQGISIVLVCSGNCRSFSEKRFILHACQEVKLKSAVLEQGPV